MRKTKRYRQNVHFLLRGAIQTEITECSNQLSHVGLDGHFFLERNGNMISGKTS